MVLDGTPQAAQRVRGMLSWDVSNGLARRAWAGNRGARFAVAQAMQAESELQVTIAEDADSELVAGAIGEALGTEA
jgi:urocanate hydratase